MKEIAWGINYDFYSKRKGKTRSILCAKFIICKIDNFHKRPRNILPLQYPKFLCHVHGSSPLEPTLSYRKHVCLLSSHFLQSRYCLLWL